MMALQSARSPWMLSDLLQDLLPVAVGCDLPITGLALDSRRVTPGTLFLACRGSSVHGLDFVDRAIGLGAAAILAEPSEQWSEAAIGALGGRIGIPLLCMSELGQRASALADRFYREPSARMSVIGITGTNGKTSVSHYLAQALAPELDCAVIGTVGIGRPGALEAATHTTPDPVTLQETLAHLQGQGVEAVAMEVSSHALDQGRAAAVRFSHAVFTNLSRDHLDYHGAMDGYAEAKAALFRSPGLSWALINRDDACAERIHRVLAAEVAVAEYGLGSESSALGRRDLWVGADAVEPLHRGLRIAVRTSVGAGSLEVGLLGRFNASNLLAVLAVMLSRGQPLEPALQRLRQVRGVPGRMECFDVEGAPLVVVDYAHTPDALEKVLQNLRPHGAGRIFTVFGCGGDRDRGKRPLMGAVAERLSDCLILTDDNPRTEGGDVIVDDIVAGCSAPGSVRIERQRALAIRLAVALAGREDVVLIAGKGHETTQDFGELKVHFSDRAQAVQALQEYTEGRR